MPEIFDFTVVSSCKTDTETNFSYIKKSFWRTAEMLFLIDLLNQTLTAHPVKSAYRHASASKVN